MSETKTKKGLIIYRASSVEYPSKIVVNEVFVTDKFGNNNNYFFDDLHFLNKDKRITFESKIKRKQAVKDFLKLIKKVETITECESIYNKIHKLKEVQGE